LVSHRRPHGNKLAQAVHDLGPVSPLNGALELSDKPERGFVAATGVAALVGGWGHVRAAANANDR